MRHVQHLESSLKASEWFVPEILKRIPLGMTRLNITCSERMMRKDILDVRVLDKKINRLEINTKDFSMTGP